ncbi:MAG: PEP-CTERM sorting domain-containing protein [Alphaproteobacteria bacterium]|nr:PEP-CTERM sorting domain-containing protein [Alphaproteobacteria bacterium]MBV9378516.1 PEP-CTERM sorting domain-containing protein [Alphaproteobacteria bacterium]
MTPAIVNPSVPEPSTLALLLSGVVGLAIMRRRRTGVYPACCCSLCDPFAPEFCTANPIEFPDNGRPVRNP